MTKLFVLFYLIHSLVDAKTNVDTKIEKTSSEIGSYAKTQEAISKKMDETAQAIMQHEKEIKAQQESLKRLKEELAEKESTHNENVKEIKELKRSQDGLKQNGNELEEELVFTIAQSVTLSIVLEEEFSASQDSLIEYEVLESMLRSAKVKIKELNDKFHENSKNIEVLNKHVSTLEAAIASIDSKKREVERTQAANIVSLKELKIARESYKDELKDILNKQDSLKKTLAQLNIIKIDELKKAEEEAQRKEAFSEKPTAPSSGDLPQVKSVGSSYQAAKTKLYVGEKTIPPFEPYKITKKYGNYTDPIYGIKVFNESISLKPAQENEKVRTVFNGKVIYADKTPVLNNIVIIEHDDGIHTIYANLSQIAPDIEKGKKVKKGYTIGRVSDELIFEVTQKSFHINPSSLFQ
ncbi:Peptidase M23B [Sulfurimonas denitrificans DSM 1251]|jgi:septal ring factor EnvC (AmiA/AmiB activator)|uniref:Peptidase M23B n=1 Tax=Sulfurimonas denitrificans (strain ATCC 33889 / DSM 1251) TaxID=326298 RepID=Q30SG4_SULDN|nr:peptidoglycan DD-metalloendopeptidase family protein [Sulfurimonas denitrificans]ABB44067.1 Peptidase M23B [Sulfurimonas denitrificans DSM 1251]MDD3441909.1 peptidoglycan DD-metalloendopeptidase family protein [Sulfurimonas denitrificans]